MTDSATTRELTRAGASFARRYGLALVSVAAALLLDLLFRHFNLPHPFSAFALSAIAVTFWYGGTKPGIVAVLLSSLIRGFIFEGETSSLAHVLYELVFVTFAILMIWVIRRKEALEVAIADRTAKLTVANEDLQRSEANLLESQRLVHMCSWAYNISSGMVTLSPEGKQIFGVESDQDVGPPNSLRDRIHPEDRPVVEDIFRRAQLEKTDYNISYRIVLPNGSIKHIDSVAHPVLNQSGEVVEFFGTSMDVTEQWKSRIELEKAFEEIKQRTGDARRSERELRDVVNSVPAHVWSTSPEGEVDFVNDRWLQFTGLGSDEAFGWKWEAVVHPDDRTRVAAEWQAALKNGQAMESEARVRRVDGEYCWWFIRNVPLRDETGKLVRWYGTAIDIEDRKRAEEALQRSEFYLREAQALSHMGSWAWRLPGRDLVHLSDEWYRIYGFDPNQGMPTLEERLQRIHPEDRNKWREAREKAIRDKSNYEVEFRILLPDGTIKWVHTVGHPELAASGDLVQFVGTSMDVTEQHEARAALLRAFEQIKAEETELRQMTDAITTYIYASSAEFVGGLRFGESSKRVKQGQFHCFIGSKAKGSSGNHSYLVVETLDSAA